MNNFREVLRFVGCVCRAECLRGFASFCLVFLRCSFALPLGLLGFAWFCLDVPLLFLWFCLVFLMCSFAFPLVLLVVPLVFLDFPAAPPAAPAAPAAAPPAAPAA